MPDENQNTGPISMRIGGPLPWFLISLCLYGEDLDPDLISAALGCPATTSFKAGGDRKFGMWQLALAKGEAPADIELAVRRLLSKLRCGEGMIAELPGVERTNLTVATSLPDWNRGFDLSSELLELIAKQGLTFGVSVYRD